MAGLIKRQEAILQKYAEQVNGDLPIMYDDLPQSVRSALESAKFTETLWSDTERWISDWKTKQLIARRDAAFKPIVFGVVGDRPKPAPKAPTPPRIPTPRIPTPRAPTPIPAPTIVDALVAWIEALPMFTPERDELATLLPFLRTAEGRALAEQMIAEAKARPAPVEAIAEVTVANTAEDPEWLADALLLGRRPLDPKDPYSVSLADRDPEKIPALQLIADRFGVSKTTLLSAAKKLLSADGTQLAMDELQGGLIHALSGYQVSDHTSRPYLDRVLTNAGLNYGGYERRLERISLRKEADLEQPPEELRRLVFQKLYPRMDGASQIPYTEKWYALDLWIGLEILRDELARFPSESDRYRERSRFTITPASWREVYEPWFDRLRPHLPNPEEFEELVAPAEIPLDQLRGTRSQFPFRCFLRWLIPRFLLKPTAESPPYPERPLDYFWWLYATADVRDTRNDLFSWFAAPIPLLRDFYMWANNDLKEKALTGVSSMQSAPSWKMGSAAFGWGDGPVSLDQLLGKLFYLHSSHRIGDNPWSTTGVQKEEGAARGKPVKTLTVTYAPRYADYKPFSFRHIQSSASDREVIRGLYESPDFWRYYYLHEMAYHAPHYQHILDRYNRVLAAVGFHK